MGEKTLSTTEDEFATLKEMYDNNQEEVVNDLKTQPTIIIEDVEVQPQEEEEELQLSLISMENTMNTSTTTLDTISDDVESEEVKSLQDKLASVEDKLNDANDKYESLKNAHGAINVELTVAQQQLCEALKLLDEKCQQIEAQQNEPSEPKVVDNEKDDQI